MESHKLIKNTILILICVVTLNPILPAEEKLQGFDAEIRVLAEKCRIEIIEQFNQLLSSKTLTINDLFDTLYIPIPSTYPQKYQTRYDKYTDKLIRPIIDKYLKMDRNIIFVVPVDRNGYLPTHNSKYTQRLTGNPETDTINNRTKRIFNDRTGLSAARNTQLFLLQGYSRDTGELMKDFSIPIFIDGKHWGALRIGYKSK